MAKIHEYFISIGAYAEDDEGNLLGDVLVVNATTEAEARRKVEVPDGFFITDVSKNNTEDEPDEILPPEDGVE